jgi:hypothetical protein
VVVVITVVIFVGRNYVLLPSRLLEVGLLFPIFIDDLTGDLDNEN